MSFIKHHKKPIVVIILILALASVLVLTKNKDSYSVETQSGLLSEVAPDSATEDVPELQSTPLPDVKAPELEEAQKTTPIVSITPEPTPVLSPQVPVRELETETEAVNSIDDSENIENLYCSLLISCDRLKDNLMLLPPEKRSIVPDDGIIFYSDKVVFYEGESVFNVLAREMKKNKIHLEFVQTPVYDSVYIEGIANLYQFDAGELSGWVYRVNGKIPSSGCSLHILENGDKVEFLYTCDLGADVR